MAVLLGLAAIDPEVRAYLTGLFSGGAWSEIDSTSSRIQEATLLVFRAVRDQSFEHGPLMMFGLAATVLLLFMLRT